MNKKKKNLFSPTPSVVKGGTVAMLCLMLTGLFLVAGCKKDDEKKDTYPKDIPFTEYSLPENCQWEHLGYDDKVMLINNREELDKYIACTDGNDPVIDFSKHTLLLASGKGSGIFKIAATDLQQFSASEYKLDIEILLNGTDILQQWTVALIVEKVSKESIVELSITTSNKEPEYPIDIPLTKYSLVGTSCGWIFENHPSPIHPTPCLIVINSDEEMEKHVFCYHLDSYPDIDFTQHTLLWAYGYADHDVSEFIIENLQQLSINEYKLNIGMALDVNTVAREWGRAFTVSKLSEESSIELNITYEYYPIEIPFADYYMYHSYVDPPCWDVLYPLNGSLTVINSEKELEKYFICADDYPVIDFSKHTLLMASGLTGWVIGDINVVFLKNNANLYTLKATISTGILTVGEYWSIAILVPKIEDDAIVIFIKN